MKNAAPVADLRNWAYTEPRNPVLRDGVYRFDAHPVGVYYATRLRDKYDSPPHRAHRLPNGTWYRLTVNYYEQRAGSHWADLGPHDSARDAVRAAAAHYAENCPPQKEMDRA